MGFQGAKEEAQERVALLLHLDIRKQIIEVTRRYKNIESDRKAYAEETQA